MKSCIEDTLNGLVLSIILPLPLRFNPIKGVKCSFWRIIFNVLQCDNGVNRNKHFQTTNFLLSRNKTKSFDTNMLLKVHRTDSYKCQTRMFIAIVMPFYLSALQRRTCQPVCDWSNYTKSTDFQRNNPQSCHYHVIWVVENNFLTEFDDNEKKDILKYILLFMTFVAKKQSTFYSLILQKIRQT